MIKTITLDIRNPRTAAEKKLDGETTGDLSSSVVFINRRADNVSTFFHEMAHVFCNFSGRRLSPDDETRFAWNIGQLAAALFDASQSVTDNHCFDKRDIKAWKEKHK